jgi:hypothetical protein
VSVEPTRAEPEIEITPLNDGATPICADISVVTETVPALFFAVTIFLIYIPPSEAVNL